MANTRVRDVMMPEPWTIPATCSLQDAAQVMRAWDVLEVYVVDDGRFCGVLTAGDTVVIAIASGRSPIELSAGECVNPDALRLQGEQLLPDALADMRRHSLRRAPVVEGAHLVGTAWLDDLQQALQTSRHPEPRDGREDEPPPPPVPPPGPRRRSPAYPPATDGASPRPEGRGCTRPRHPRSNPRRPA